MGKVRKSGVWIKMDKKEANEITLNIFTKILRDRFKHNNAKVIEAKKDEMKNGNYRITCVIEIEHRKGKKVGRE